MRNGRRGIIGEPNLHLLGALYEHRRMCADFGPSPAWQPPAFPISNGAWAYMNALHPEGDYDPTPSGAARGLQRGGQRP